jgi:sarcosine oxidase subunit beta
MNQVVSEEQVCVVGAGVMGLSAAYQIAATGMRVLVLEQSVPGQAASAATAGTLALQNKPLAAIPLVVLAVEWWKRASDELGVDVEYERRGGFRVAHSTTDVENLEKAVLAQRRLGVAAEMVYQPQLSREAPYLDPAIQAASYCADDGMANPLAVTRALCRECNRRGVRIWTNCRVDRIHARGDRDFVIQTSRGAVRTAAIVAAGGAWNGELAQMVDITLPITAEILQVVVTDIAPPMFPHIVTHVRGNLTVKQAKAPGKILIGGAWRGDGDWTSGRKQVRRESLVGSLQWAVKNIPGMSRARLLRAWVGFEGRSPDKLLLSGDVGSSTGFHVLGCAGGGFTISPIAGILAANYVTGRPSQVSAEPFHVTRFLAERAATERHRNDSEFCRGADE